MTEPLTRHPAKFSPEVLRTIRTLIYQHAKPLKQTPPLVLDPFAGVGRIHELEDVHHLARTVGVELQPRWAACHRRTRVGDATRLPHWWTNRFDVVATSPCYGNRYADHHNAADGSLRRSYTHDYGAPLEPGNAGIMPFGSVDYAELHVRAWRQVRRVLGEHGLFLLNVSNFVRRGEVVDVVGWHRAHVESLGFSTVDCVPVPTKRMRMGANADARVAYEVVLMFRKGTTCR